MTLSVTRRALGLAVAGAWFGGVALAQQAAPAAGEIHGVVRDNTRAMVPGAEIRVDSRRLPAPIVVTSDGAGYRVPDLAAGTYTWRVTMRGFVAETRENVVVPAGGSVSLDASLLVAAPGHDVVIPPDKTRVAALPAGEIAVEFWTDEGDFDVAVDTKHAPITSANFLKYVDAGFYDLGRFHRVTRPGNYTPAPPNRPMMEIVQAGADPFRWREAFPPIPLERTSVTGLKHVRGTVSMARGNGADTATSDFFILLDDQPSLDFGGQRFDDGQGAAAFGRVVSGMDVIQRIQQAGPLRPAPNQQYLVDPVQIRKAFRTHPQAADRIR